MALGDIRIVKGREIAVTFQTEANATAILAGEPVKLKAAGSPYVIPCADGDLTIGTDTAFIGVAASSSTHTASADGTVRVYMPLPDNEYEMKATTYANVDTQAEINALVGDRVSFDLAGGVYTLDENAGDDAANALYILGGDPVTGKIRFSIRTDATRLSA